MNAGNGCRVSLNQIPRLSRSASLNTSEALSAQGSLQKNILSPGGDGYCPLPPGNSEVQSGLRVLSLHTPQSRGSRPVHDVSSPQVSMKVSNGVGPGTPARPKRRTTPVWAPQASVSALATSAAAKGLFARSSHGPPSAQLLPPPPCQVQPGPSAPPQLPRRNVWSGIRTAAPCAVAPRMTANASTTPTMTR